VPSSHEAAADTNYLKVLISNDADGPGRRKDPAWNSVPPARIALRGERAVLAARSPSVTGPLPAGV